MKWGGRGQKERNFGRYWPKLDSPKSALTGWKWSSMACPCMLEFSLPLIPLWLVLCVLVALPGEELQSWTQSPLATARWRKERRYPELVGPGARPRLVVLGVEVGGRWSAETTGFLGALARPNSGVQCLGCARGQNGMAPPSDEDRFCHAQRVLWHLPCWSSHARPVLMERFLPSMKLSVVKGAFYASLLLTVRVFGDCRSFRGLKKRRTRRNRTTTNRRRTALPQA